MDLSYNMIIKFKLLISLVAISSLWGCDFLVNKREKGEQEILGSIEGYNLKVEEIQATLQELEFSPGIVDGRMGWRTRDAIKKFQKANDLTNNGYIDYKTWEKLNVSYSSKEAIPVSKQLSKVKEVKQAEVYLKEKDEQSKVIGTCLSSLECKKKIQLALKNNGFDPGPIDGKIGPKTRKAITNFQKAKGLKADGDITDETWKSLSKYFPKH